MNQYFSQHTYNRILSVTAQRIFILIAFAIVSLSAVADTATPNTVLSAFNAAINNNKVSLCWITGMEKDFSHFVIERSTDGEEYKDAALVFANGNSTVRQSYSFADAVNTNAHPVLYYRLRLVSTGGKYSYSATRIIKAGETVQGNQLQVYPNPVISDLRITIPEAWQNKPVSYDVYNGHGQLVKRIVNQTASQSELVNMQGMGAGLYMVKAFTGTDTAIQWIIKK
jgi:hypothetical protein